MSVAARLDRLEASLHPLDAVLLWLDQAHAFGRLGIYAAWLVEQPATSAPYERLPTVIEGSVRAALRGRKVEIIDAAVGKAITGALFRLGLVLELDTLGQRILDLERLRATALHWQHRAMAAEAAPPAAGALSAWREAVMELDARLEVFTIACADLETRYLDGHPALFPETATDLVELTAVVAGLATLRDGWSSAASPRRRSRRAASLRASAVGSMASELADRIVDSVLARTADDRHDLRGLRAMSARLLPSIDRDVLVRGATGRLQTGSER